MKFHTQLRVISMLAVAPLLFVGGFLLISTYMINMATQKIAFLNDGIKEMTAMRAIMFDYTQGATERAESQLLRIEQKLAALFAHEQFQAASERELLGRIENDYQRVQKLFVELEKNNMTLIYGEPEKQIAAREYANILLSQFSILSQNIITQSFQLHDRINHNLIATRNVYNTLLFTMIALFTLMVSVVSFFINTQLKLSVAHLLKIAHQFKSGDMNYVIDSAETNEFQEVYLAFNQMITQIKTSYQSLTAEIEDRKSAEEALRESENLLRTLSNNLPGGLVYQIDSGLDGQQRRFVYISEGVAQLHGLTSAEARQDAMRVYGQIVEEDQRMVAEREARAVIEMTPFQAEARIRMPSGEIRWRLFTSAPRRLPNQHLLWDGVEIDITEHKRAEELLKEHNRLLEEAVQQKQGEMEAMFETLLRQEKLATIGKIAGSIAHELRNPLGAVKQSIYYLKHLAQQQELAMSHPKVLRHLDLVDGELEASARVIADLLDITRMKPPHRQPTDLRALIEDAIQHSLPPEQVRVTLTFEPEPLTIDVDPLQFRQVLLNVLTNAIQALDGTGEIAIHAKQLPEQGETLLEIHDTGVGVAPENIAKVFEPLYTTKTTGTGLGLSICKQIMDSHQGRISLASLPGQGTTVMLAIPGERKP
ncbi:multi-sensor hybrid histidine kinase [Candidatus Moduliflexus flocculans]|uniref:histidine kinase n=1 Tax=Candidatus Moduliflexus flocculans TaxID=1499966 RepID=A0A081BN91_9BACT|nr:multi-sensor hybrid histidine kinase [Candidatus Moduliflexus flocculans]